MIFTTVNPLVEKDWNGWIGQHPQSTIFHTAEWARVLFECYRYPIQYGVVKDGESVPAMLPLMEVSSVLTGRRGVSLPFSDDCCPLLSNGVTLTSVVAPLLSIGKSRRWAFCELRGNAEEIPGATITDEFVHHRLTLEPTEQLQWSKLKDTHRRNIQKAMKHPLEVHSLQTPEAMDAYYQLHCLTRKRQGVPPQSRRFFSLIQQHIIKAGLGFILLARFDGQWIAGAVYLHFANRAIYKFGASDARFQNLRANNLIMWEAIKRCRNAGMTEFSFGRSDSSNAGLLQFKRGWGSDETVLRYYRIGLAKPVHRKAAEPETSANWMAALIQRTPIHFLRLLGAVAYRHMG